MEIVAIRMEDEDIKALKERAAELRVPYTILARMLIMQGLKAGVQVTEPEASR